MRKLVSGKKLFSWYAACARKAFLPLDCSFLVLCACVVFLLRRDAAVVIAKVKEQTLLSAVRACQQAGKAAFAEETFPEFALDVQ